MPDDQHQEDVSIETPIAKFKARGSDILVTVFGTVVVAGVVLLGYVLFEHKADATQNGSLLAGAIREMTHAQREGVQAQRVMNCLLATNQSERQQMLATCERIAR